MAGAPARAPRRVGAVANLRPIKGLEILGDAAAHVRTAYPRVEFVVAGEGEATVVLGPGFRPRVVDGLFTGMHARGTSHFALLRAFATEELLNRAMEHAECVGYLEHEFGDSCLLLPTASPAPATANAPNVSEA